MHSPTIKHTNSSKVQGLTLAPASLVGPLADFYKNRIVYIEYQLQMLFFTMKILVFHISIKVRKTFLSIFQQVSIISALVGATLSQAGLDPRGNSGLHVKREADPLYIRHGGYRHYRGPTFDFGVHTGGYGGANYGKQLNEE